jgi:hypothetical protein
MWQMWTAFGIMCGYLSGVAFAKVDGSLKWRLMLGSPVRAGQSDFIAQC